MTFTITVHAAPPPINVPPGGIEKMSSMKGFIWRQLENPAIYGATDFHYHAANRIKVSWRQADWSELVDSTMHSYDQQLV